MRVVGAQPEELLDVDLRLTSQKLHATGVYDLIHEDLDGDGVLDVAHEDLDGDGTEDLLHDLRTGY